MWKIEIENNYIHGGNGIHSSVDTDRKRYVYSTLFPCHANNMIPCFDQPDEKEPERIAIANVPAEKAY